MADPTLSSPHHHLFLRRGKCAGLESSSSHSSPHPRLPRPQMTVCTHCKARHWEARCSYLPLSGPIPTFNSYLKARIAKLRHSCVPRECPVVQQRADPRVRVFGHLYHRLGALIPAVNQRPAFAQTWLIDPAEATDTRLGPDGADSRIQRSTLTKLEPMLRTKDHFVREFASAKTRAGWDTAKESALRLCRPPGRDRRTHNLPTSWTSPSAMPLRYPLLFPAGENAFHPNIPLCGFHQAGPPIARNREQIDNGVQLREVLAGLGLDDEDEEEDEDRDDEDEDGEEGEGEHQGEGLEVDQPESCVPNSLHTTFTNAATISQSRVPPGVSFSRFVIDGYSQVETDRLNSIRLHQENLRLTTAQGIAEAVANSLTPDQMGRYQGTMACVVKYEKPSLFITVTCIPGRPEIQAALGPKDQACNRPDLIARVFEAKLNRLCDDGNKQGAGWWDGARSISPVYLHSINPSDFPAHHLRLKEGIPVVLLRNLDPDAGLCNGTCLIVLHARSQVIPAIILTGD
ncbi:BZ3500_MvSof-1268-A1-R1_Chr7-1g09057 [Microbotryum saponariae]|uniref:BZ3500_MvSof-1268-A1-R1_Chr7-1g09057 protein n=1 Tax=Microbotryum saponariae TaxID=289078 RepID=A0A2X0MV29_9BASI|nr:BZ3501_MvSof-1269-A2-R1_Chr7-1g08761 [Microbotryum saponariae]SDA02707.1 BZ3500_MvSof-1268-A1-R1_Chr7-1g09057 [Microbotryum saponariae]